MTVWLFREDSYFAESWVLCSRDFAVWTGGQLLLNIFVFSTESLWRHKSIVNALRFLPDKALRECTQTLVLNLSRNKWLPKTFHLHWCWSGKFLEAKMWKLVNFVGNIKYFPLSFNLSKHHFSSSRVVNLALSLNAESRQPVRVIRGYKLQSPFAPEYGYRYDGK